MPRGPAAQYTSRHPFPSHRQVAASRPFDQEERGLMPDVSCSWEATFTPCGCTTLTLELRGSEKRQPGSRSPCHRGRTTQQSPRCLSVAPRCHRALPRSEDNRLGTKRSAMSRGYYTTGAAVVGGCVTPELNGQAHSGALSVEVACM